MPLRTAFSGVHQPPEAHVLKHDFSKSVKTLLAGDMRRFTGPHVIRAYGSMCLSLNFSKSTSLKSSAKNCFKSFGDVVVRVMARPPCLTMRKGLGHDHPANLKAYHAAVKGPLTRE
jgi:hypothetical protein